MTTDDPQQPFDSEHVGMPAISIRKASVAEHPDIAALYERCGYSGGLSADDTILVAVRAASVVGAVRLCSEHRVAVLRGMQVLPDYQRQGIGRALLEGSLSGVDDASCYCIPWSYLERFYSSGGFERCELKNAPDFLAERFSQYTKQGRDVMLMRRVASK